MAFTTIGSPSWGSSPTIGTGIAYESKRSGADMQYRIRVTINALNSSGSYFGYPIYLSISLDGATRVSGYTLKEASPSTWASAIVYTTDWFTIANKTTGTVAFTVRLFSGQGSSRDSSYGYSLPVLAGASGISAYKGTLGVEQTLNVTRYSTSFTHTITYTCGSASGTVVSKSGSTSVKWTPPLSLAQQNTAGNTVSIKLDITTYDGSTAVGVESTTFTATIPDSVAPTVTLNLSDPTGTNAKYGGYVQSQSQLNVKIVGTGDQGSTITSYQIRVGNDTYTGNDKTVNILYAQSLEVTGIVTDSRGRSGSSTIILPVIPYTAPRISSLAVTRCAENGTPQADGTFAKVTFSAIVTPLSNGNSIAHKVEYRKAGASSWTHVDADSGANTPSGISVIFPAAADSAFEVRVAVMDNFGTVYSSLRTLPVAFALLQGDTTGTGLAVGQLATEPNVFAVGLPTKIRPGEVEYALDVTGDVRMRNAHGYVYGLGKAQATIPAGADLNTYLDFGVYAIAGNAVAETLANCPTQLAGTLIVSSGNGSGINSGAYVYILQTYSTLDGTYEFTRGISSDTSGKFTYQAWKCKSSPWWVNLGLSGSVTPAVDAYGRAGKGCFYRVVNENHVYVAFCCAISYAGATIQINTNAIPEKYRPARSVFALCAGGGRSSSRVFVNAAGNVFVEWVQDMASATATSSFELGWIDGYIDYWVT